jgi:hypothetical protein
VRNLRPYARLRDKKFYVAFLTLLACLLACSLACLVFEFVELRNARVPRVFLFREREPSLCFPNGLINIRASL